jgi:uncharacterized protein YdeI (BOF family)
MRAFRAQTERAIPAMFLVLTLTLGQGCHKAGGTVLGKAPEGTPRPVLAVKAGDTPPKVALRGAVVEKCPVAGCWFRLEDETGIILVDTKAAGFVVSDIPLRTIVTVAGKVDHVDQEVILEATGLRY